MGKILFISKTILPDNSNKAADLIYEYFNGFDIELNETADSVQIDLTANQYTYCEDIGCGLHFLGISDKDVATFCNIFKNTALCLSENWLPYALLRLQKEVGTNLDAVTIIHVDDHQDLMSPFISQKNGFFFDMISGEPIFFNDIESMSKAVKSGAITIGSMLSAIIYPISKSNVIHIKQGVAQSLYGLSKKTFYDKIITSHGERICISKKEYADNEPFYFSTDSWEEAIKRVPNNAPCILHIDMDYFNNRFNASTDWNNNANRLDPPFSTQKGLMDELVSAVSKVHIRSEIKFVLIGISPSFYPVEFWADGLEYLLNELHKVGIGAGVDILKSHTVHEI